MADASLYASSNAADMRLRKNRKPISKPRQAGITDPNHARAFNYCWSGYGSSNDRTPRKREGS